MRLGEFFGAFIHEGLLHFGRVYFGVDLIEDFLGGHAVHLARVFLVELVDGFVGGGGGGLDIGTGQGFDVLVGRVLFLLSARGGEDDLLLQGQVFVVPEFLIQVPEALGIDNANEALGGGGKTGDVLFCIDVDARHENRID